MEPLRAAAPPGELAAFAALPAARQYRLPYGFALRTVAAGSQVLDWGCGDGHFSHFLLSRGLEVTAYSLQHRPFALTALSGDLADRFRFVRGDPTEPVRLPFCDASFDAVFSIGVLEHVRETGGDEASSLAEIFRVLRPGGRLLLFHLPNRFSHVEALARLARRRAEVPAHDAFHRFRYSGREVAALVAKSGLELEARGLYGFLPRNAFARLPARLRGSERLAALIDAADDVLTGPLGAICQNHFAVARRPGPAEPSAT